MLNMKQRSPLMFRSVWWAVLVFLATPCIVVPQVATLDPASTVNPATGEMSFSLPVGVVKGLGGHDFPVNVNYKAGIRYHDKASPLGLGFSYGAGSIVRKPVFVPDDNTVGDYVEDNTAVHCGVEPWFIEFQILLPYIIAAFFVVGSVLAAIAAAAAAGAGASAVGVSIVKILVSSAVSGLKTAVLAGVGTLLVSGPADYLAGGTHLPSYNYEEAQGSGFFGGGEAYDLPDMYFVNTPYISGQLVWLGDPESGEFVFKADQRRATSVRYDKYDDDGDGVKEFEIDLADGTLLLFEVTQTAKWTTGYYSSEDIDPEGPVEGCFGRFWATQKAPAIVQWHLTEVRFPEYVEGQPERGGWIRFEYDKNVRNDVYQFDDSYQATPTVASYRGFVFEPDMDASDPDNYNLESTHLCDVYLKEIVTPNQTAEYLYRDGDAEWSEGRLDDLWFEVTDVGGVGSSDYLPGTGLTKLWYTYCTGDGCVEDYDGPNVYTRIKPVSRKVLEGIEIRSATGELISSAQMNTGYQLAPKSLHSLTRSDAISGSPDEVIFPVSYTGNSNSARLTLLGLTVTEGRTGKEFGVQFHYDDDFNPRGIPYRPAGPGEEGISYCIADLPPTGRCQVWLEERDYWGYYCPYTSHYQNDFNAEGNIERCVRDSDNMPYASAWSVQKLTLPTGMEIEWEYEAQRYDRVNGVQPCDAGGDPVDIKYGGGIRVGKVIVHDGLGNTRTTNYHYTSETGNFDENPGNCSGHASAEPFPCLAATSSADDPRPQVARGGFYTPCRVMYEKVQVENEGDDGYVVYEFTSPAEYPNGGQYGEVDQGWKHGLVKSVERRNENDEVVSRQGSDYSFISRPHPVQTHNPNAFPFYTRLYQPCGWVGANEITETVDDVAATTRVLFAKDLPGSTERTRVQQAVAEYKPYTTSFSRDIRFTLGGDCLITRTLGEDQDRDDLLVMQGWTRTEGAFPILHLLPDVPRMDADNQGFSWANNLDNNSFWVTWGDRDIPCGMTITDIDGNDAPDLMVALIYYPISVFNAHYLEYVIYKDLTRDQNSLDFSHKLFWRPRDQAIPLAPDRTTNEFRPLGSCAGSWELYGDSEKPDVVFVTYSPNPTLDDNKCQIIIAADLDSDGQPGVMFYSDELAGLPSYTKILGDDGSTDNHYWAFSSKLLDIDDNARPDLTISGTVDVPGNPYRQRIKTILFKNLLISGGEVVCDLPLDEIQESSFAIEYEDAVQNPTCLQSLGVAYCDADTAKPLYTIIQPAYHFWENNLPIFVLAGGRQTLGDYDGQPNRIIRTNSDGSQLITVPEQAWWHYPGMESRNMLTQACATRVYQGSVGDQNALQASATNWREIDGRWLPRSNYVWRYTEGTKDPSFTHNQTGPDEPGAQWLLTDSITLVDTATLSSLPHRTVMGEECTAVPFSKRTEFILLPPLPMRDLHSACRSGFFAEFISLIDNHLRGFLISRIVAVSSSHSRSSFRTVR